MGYRDILVTEEYIKAYFEMVKHTIPEPIEYFGYYDNSFNPGQPITPQHDRIYTIYYSKKPFPARRGRHREAARGQYPEAHDPVRTVPGCF